MVFVGDVIEPLKAELLQLYLLADVRFLISIAPSIPERTIRSPNSSPMVYFFFGLGSDVGTGKCGTKQPCDDT